VHLVHAIPGFSRPGRAIAAADGVLSDTAMRPTTAIAEAARIRRRWLLLAMPLAITPPSAEDQLTITAQPTPNNEEPSCWTSRHLPKIVPQVTGGWLHRSLHGH
jgi:hypothetical protein